MTALIVKAKEEETQVVEPTLAELKSTMQVAFSNWRHEFWSFQHGYSDWADVEVADLAYQDALADFRAAKIPGHNY